MPQIFRQNFICIVTVKLIQSLRFLSDYSVKQLLLKCFRSIRTTKLRARILFFQLHESTFSVTGRDVGSGYCIVVNAPTSPLNSEMIWNISLFKIMARKKFFVKFKSKLGYQEFPGFYALRQHTNTQRRTPVKTTRCWFGRYHQPSWWCESQIGIALMSTFLCRAWTRMDAAQRLKK